MSAPVIYALLGSGLVLGLLAYGPDLKRVLAQRARVRAAARRRPPAELRWDPGRDLRAERKAEQLMRSVVGERDFALYRELGILQVDGAPGPDGESEYGYLIYPHRPIVSYEIRSGRPLSEYCIQFPDRSTPLYGSRLPNADDVLAKWMTLHGDERAIIAEANMHALGRQIDPDQARRDIERLGEWRRRHDDGGAIRLPTPDPVLSLDPPTRLPEAIS